LGWAPRCGRFCLAPRGAGGPGRKEIAESEKSGAEQELRYDRPPAQTSLCHALPPEFDL
jgi:hypothetical protein